MKKIDRQSDRPFIFFQKWTCGRGFSELNLAHCLQNYSSNLFKNLRCERNNIFPHFCFSTHLILSKNSFVVFLRVYHRVFSRNVLHENRAKIAQRFAYVSSKICTQFRCFCAKAISRKFCRKSWYLRISLFPAISLFR